MTPRRTRRDYLIRVPDDGLPAREVGPWVEQKYRYFGMYAEMFSTGMKNSWDRRIYLDLFSGSGRSQIRSTNTFVLGSPLLAMSLPDPFDLYVFSDEDRSNIDALRKRATESTRASTARYVVGDINTKVQEVIGHIDAERQSSTLSFCFLDPYKLNIHFSTVRTLAEGRPIDFLILLALYVDANRNMKTYVQEEKQQIDRFLGDRDWRATWKQTEQSGETIVAFLARAYSQRMAGLGYLPMTLADMVKIRSNSKNLPLYYLAFYSRNQTGMKFWREVLKYADDQLSLDLYEPRPMP